MKRFLTILISFLSIIFLFGCKEEKKADIIAPTINSIYQDNNGSVYLTCNLTNEDYTPYVYFNNSDAFHLTQSSDGNIQILSYFNGNFYYHDSFEEPAPFTAGSSISVKIKESETHKTNESPLSNSISITLKEPQNITTQFTDCQSILGITEGSYGYDFYESVGIAYDAINNKFVFAKGTYTHTQITISEETVFFAPYEYTILTPAQVSQYTQYGGINIDEAAVKTLTFKDCTTIDIDDSMFVDDVSSSNMQSLTTNKVCYMVYRLKETSTKLESRCLVVAIHKPFNSFGFRVVSDAPFSIYAVIDGAVIQPDSVASYHLNFNSPNKSSITTITSANVNDYIKVVRKISFGYLNQYTNFKVDINGSTVVLNNGEDVGASNIGQENISLVGMIGSEVKVEYKLKIIGPQN